VGAGDIALALGVLAGAFLLGGCPTAFVIGKVFFKTDIREHGSGNVGATNAYRVLGMWPGILVVAIDILKGFLAVSIAAWASPAAWEDWLMVGAALAVVAGHTYTPFLGFDGGKGIATGTGAVLRLTPLSVAILAPVFFGVTLSTRMVSLGSLAIAILYPVTVLLLYADRPATTVFAFIAAPLVVWRHRANIRRILRGEESRISLHWRGLEEPEGSEEDA
jgi:glycerol-3-phosphate acyltransferase PlsY